MANLNIERLLAKFGMKGINYGAVPGGKATFSVEEQLAMVGICWDESPAGWQCLMVECLADQAAYRELLAVMHGEANRRMQQWRGTFPQDALTALAITAIAESTQQRGTICGECLGTGKTKTRAQQWRKCPACKEGRVPWTNETRYAKFARTLDVPYSRFTRYKPVLEELVDWLTMGRTAALLRMQGQMDKEKAEAKKAA